MLPTTAKESPPSARSTTREEPVLFGQCQCGVRAAAGEGRDAPVRGVGCLVGVPGLVRAVEGAQPQVDDAHGRLWRRAQAAVQLGKFHGGFRLGVCWFDAHSLKTLRGEPSTSVDDQFMGAVLADAVLRHEPGQEGGLDPAGRIVAGRDGAEGAGVVDEAGGAGESGGFGHGGAEAQHGVGASRNHHGAPR